MLPRYDGVGLVALAVDLADELGLDAISVRLLADRAGIPVHLLYRQVRNRADLLGAMAEQVIDAHRPRHAPRPDGARAELAQLARDEWAMYRRHPWLLRVLATDRPPTGPAVLAMVDRVVAVLVDAGFSPADAYRAYLVLSGYVQGMALLIGPGSADTDSRAWRSATRRRLERTGRLQRRPWLTAASQTDPDTDLDTWFEFGLRGMLAGLLPSPGGTPPG
ncbi:TetR/AcrR family transcriptional regulator C-terminal domain-containing protein [Micromonospora sp. NPDC092111]|uniref:TetR/AcrR family transcriptional regulator C-terminal domain-containing protein n=1 Tax=Micromonospora sp. NPDC092111 TaxID=3364289 RepID=UPI00381BB9D5